MSYTNDKGIFTLPIPTQSGKYFVAWYIDAACTSAPMWKFSAGRNVDMTLYAKWADTEAEAAAVRAAAIAAPVDDITIKELQSTLDKETKTYYPAKDMQSTLSHMFKIAMAQKLTAVNLSRFLVLPENNEKEGEPFVETELHKMWAAWSPGDTILGSILLMIYTGMMPGEMLRLYVCNVDREAMEITDIGLKTAVRREAPIPYPHFLAPIIDDLILHAGKKGKMVPVQKDNYYTRYYAKLAELGIRKLPPYSCRHTTGTALAKGNIAPATIQKAMRHAKLSRLAASAGGKQAASTTAMAGRSSMVALRISIL